MFGTSRRTSVRDGAQHRPAGPDGALALIVHANQVERLGAMHQLDVFLTQQTHSMLRKKLGRERFRFRVGFMIAVAAPNAQRRAQPRQLVDAGFERVARGREEIAGDDGEVGAEIVGHVHGAADLGRGHVAADVDIAQLGDAQTFQSGWQAAHRQVHAMYLVMQTLEGEAVGSGGEWDGAGDGRDGLDEPAPPEIERRSRGLRRRTLRRIFSRALLRAGPQPGHQEARRAQEPVDRRDQLHGEVAE